MFFTFLVTVLGFLFSLAFVLFLDANIEIHVVTFSELFKGAYFIAVSIYGSVLSYSWASERVEENKLNKERTKAKKERVKIESERVAAKDSVKFTTSTPTASNDSKSLQPFVVLVKQDIYVPINILLTSSGDEIESLLDQGFNLVSLEHFMAKSSSEAIDLAKKHK
ncbi:hypothetical protein [Vibrio breoganii]|uniref:hypothetical protein n=1 Tax=Vibrio breoganii TaxID=553239 RepID=UPI000C82A322|nr:hypothetical protein [Vibrio breoganii]PML10429.1 hypothetical protein BCT84_17355 [Vibrio breoganii]